MSVQLFAKFLFSITAMLAGMVIPGARAAGLPVPIRPIVGIMPTTPYGIIFPVPVLSLPIPKALHITEEVFPVFDLVGFPRQGFAAPATGHLHALIGAALDKLGGPLSHTFSAAKVVILDGTGRYFPLFAAPITLDYGWWVLAFGVAIMGLSPIGMPGRALEFFTAPRTLNRYPFLSRLAGALSATVFLVPSKIGLEIKNFAAVLANEGQQFLGAAHLSARQFSAALIGASKPAIMLTPAALYCVGFTTDRASPVDFHKVILAQMFTNVKLVYEVIGALLVSYADIAQARLAYWASQAVQAEMAL